VKLRLVAAALFGLLAGGVGVALLRRIGARLPRDDPNARSLHVRPIPRAGGYAIWAGFLPVALLWPPSFALPGLAGWLPAWLAVALVSAADDARGVRAGPRLVVHCAAALACAYALWRGASADTGVAPHGALAWAGLIGMTLAIAWMANLYNFMDGSDGLAATMAVAGFGAYAIAAHRAGADAAAFVALAAAALAFLAVNRPRATMFLGDVGSVPIGFLAAAFGLSGAMTGMWPAWFPVLVFLPFVADATVTLVRRAARGENLAQAHRDHYYQRLNRMGAGHGGTLAAYALAMIATAGSALYCLTRAPGWGMAALGFACVVCFILFGAIDHRWRRRTEASR